MNIAEFKAMWDWCSQTRNNDEFWRRFVLASAAYSPKQQAALIRFANVVWFDAE